MRFSQAMEYGITGLMELAKANQETSLSEIANRANVPESFLAKIFQKLHRAGVINSRRGKGGGFFFPPEKQSINLWEIHEIIEGPTSLQACVGDHEAHCGCSKMDHCLLQEVWREAQESLESVLKKRTIANLVQKKAKT